MTFTQQMMSTFVGAMFAFIFSLCLFYITGRLTRRSLKKTLEGYLLKELQFDRIMLEGVVKDLEKALQQVSVGDREVYVYLRYSMFQGLFMTKYFQEGYLYDKLLPEEVGKLDNMLSHYIYGEKFINDQIEGWKQGGIDQKEMARKLQFEKEQTEDNIKAIDAIREKIGGR